MKQTVAISMLVISLLNCTYMLKQYDVYERQDVIVFTEEIGEVIDAEERERYDLFPGVEGFQDARFYKIAGGGYEVEMVTRKGDFVSVNWDEMACQILTDYFTQHNNEHYNQTDFEEKWEIIDYDALGFPITKVEISRHSSRVGCCITGCCFGGVAGSVIGVAIGKANDSGGSDDYDYTVVSLFLTGTMGSLLGSVHGFGLSDWYALTRIKELRKPRVIDKY
jgi:hypothetical protein